MHDSSFQQFFKMFIVIYLYLKTFSTFNILNEIKSRRLTWTTDKKFILNFDDEISENARSWKTEKIGRRH